MSPSESPAFADGNIGENRQTGEAAGVLGLQADVAADGFQVAAEGACPIRADHALNPGLDLWDEFLSDLEHFVPAFSWLHELCTPVTRIGHPDDITVSFEVPDEFGHGLFGHLGTLGEDADGRPGVVKVLKDCSVRRAHPAMPALGQPADDQIIESDERLPQQRDEVEGSFPTLAHWNTS